MYSLQQGVELQHAALVGGDEVLDVDKGILAAALLKELQGVLDEVAQVLLLLLPVVNVVANVLVLRLEDVEDGQQLAVVGHQGLSNQASALQAVVGLHKALQHLERSDHDLGNARVEGGLDRDNELRNDGQDLGASHVQHVIPAHAVCGVRWEWEGQGVADTYTPWVAMNRYGSSSSRRPSKKSGR